MAKVTDALATVADYKAITGKSVGVEDTEIGNALLAVSRHIESRLGRFFTVDAADVTRTYIVGTQGGEPPGGHQVLEVDDLSADPTSIKIDKDNDGLFTDETALLSTDYELHPLNAALGPEPRPFESIRLTPWGDEITWATGLRVEVIAKWGWPAIPQAIVEATCHLAAILRLESPRATKRIPDEIGADVETSREAQQIIWQIMNTYRRPFV